jgi:hypothetical protein
MSTRCKPGDLAVIIHDEPGCEANIGKIVRVEGPLFTSPERGAQWPIRPARARGTWLFLDGVGGLLVKRRNGLRRDDEVVHPDAWMTPIAGPSIASRISTVVGAPAELGVTPLDQP